MNAYALSCAATPLRQTPPTGQRRVDEDRDGCSTGPSRLPTGGCGYWFGVASRREAAGYAEFAAGAVDLALRMAHHRQLSADLQAALASREVIDQAVGIIMAQQRCLPREAFAVLRRMSQLRNVKLAAVSAAIVAGVSGHPPQPGRFTAR